MTRLLLAIGLVGFLPGALAFRLPFADRSKRAALAAEERAFWYVMLSVVWSLATVLVMGALREYRFDRLLIVNAIVSLILAIAGRGRMSYSGAAARPSWTMVLPLALIGIGFWRFLPASEYIIGGKDPGVYLNEGVLLARTGDLVVPDPVVAQVPASALGLFFPQHVDQPVYSNRFMGVYLLDPASGDVVGQFPQAYPASIAIGYDVAGIDGARLAGLAWAVFGLVAVYFLGARLVGRPAAFAASTLLSLQAIQLWFARIPSSEMAMQAVFFAALLATARAHQDEQRFFAPVAAGLAVFAIFIRIDALLGLVGIVAAIVLAWLAKRGRLWPSFVVVTAAGLLVTWPYLTGPLRGYLWRPIVYLQHLPAGPVLGAIAATIVAGLALVLLRRRRADRVASILPIAIAAALVLLALYAVWLRPLLRPDDSKIAIYDAYALRTFVSFYLSWPAFVAALGGIVLVLRRDFWRDPAFVLVFAAFSMFLFYKVQVVPTHFWMARRFLPIILPGALLFVAAAALGFGALPTRRWPLIRTVAGTIFLVIVGWQYRATAVPLGPHREYDGMVRTVERLASRFRPRDLVIVEGRNTGQDTHVLALPLAYVYGRNVLELSSPRPDKMQLAAFLADALTKYERVYFVGGGGTDLRSRRISATPVADARVHVSEYQATDWNEYPHDVRRKDFDYTVYQLHLDQPSEGPFVLDVGFEDDLYVVRFFAKEQTEGRTIRWTQRQSFIAVPGLTGAEREVQFVLHDGGRPAQAPPAQVEVFFDEVRLGTLDVGKGFATYKLALPADAVRRAAGRDDPAQLRLVSTVWNPKRILGGSDDRDLGVMIDKVEIH